MKGFEGLMDGEYFDMDRASVGGIIRGGDSPPDCPQTDQTAEGQRKAMEEIQKHGVDALAVIGGDGSFRGAEARENGPSRSGDTGHHRQ